MGRFRIYTLLLLVSWISAAGALSISFPPHGPISGSDSQNVSWKRDKNDPNAQFFFQKIKLDDPTGPTAKSTPVPVPGSENKEGTSPMAFNRAGLFEILAVNIQNGQSFWTTEVTVNPNPTITPSPSATSGQGSKKLSDPNNMKMGNNSPLNASSLTNSTLSSIISAPVTIPTESLTSSIGSASEPSAVVKSGQTTTIVGAVVGSVALFFIFGVILLCFRYRTRRATSNFVQAKMVRDYNPNLDDVGTGWSTPVSEKAKPALGDDYRNAPSPSRRTSLRPMDSVSNIGLGASLILPPIPVARSLAGSDVSTSSKSSSIRRTRDKNALRLSASTLSTSTGASGSGSLFPIPTLPPRTRTDRQMLIEEDIQRLQARMLFLQGRGDISPISHLEREEELKQIDMKVDRLKAVHESRWALGLTDEVPDGLF